MEHYCQLPDGRLLLLDGINPVKTWDGLAAAPVDAGLPATATPLVLTPSATTGQILGTYQAYVRYLDALNQVSDFSPASAQLTVNAANGFVGAATQTNPVTITNTNAGGALHAHGLATGAAVTITGALGMTELNATWTVTVLDASHFTLDGSEGLSFGVYVPLSAVWTAGTASIAYTIPPSPSTKATRVQVLRNTAGQLTTFYVDLDLPAGTLVGTTTKDDNTLATGTAVPLLNPDGTLNALAHGVPPNYKEVALAHLGRVFYLVDGVYKTGAVIPINGSNQVIGIATNWKTTLAGRFLYVNGATASYQIASVDQANQVLTLTTNYADATQGYALYAIRPAPAVRRLVYYTEAGQPESVPATNAFSLQEDGDEMVGGMVTGSFLFIVEARHIYRYTFQTNPATDGQAYLACERGAVNHRCIVQVEDLTYMLDQAGVHAYGGAQDTEAVSSPIQRLFQPGQTQFGINWRASDTFHGAADPTTEILRFFVALGGDSLPHHAICYHYRLKRFWIEQYNRAVVASSQGVLQNFRHVFAAGEGLRTWLVDRGTLDGLDATHGGLRGTVSSATASTLTDVNGAFTADLVGEYVYVTDGRGRSQGRKITGATATQLKLKDPWRIKPDTTSTYQVGGIPFYYLSGTFFFAPGEDETDRAFAVYWTPTRTPGTFDLRIYYDNDNDPQTMRNTHHALQHEGFSTLEGDVNLTADMTRVDGYAQQRIDNRRERNLPGVRQVSFELLGVSTGDPVTFSQLVIGGTIPPAGG